MMKGMMAIKRLTSWLHDSCIVFTVGVVFLLCGGLRLLGYSYDLVLSPAEPSYTEEQCVAIADGVAAQYKNSKR